MPSKEKINYPPVLPRFESLYALVPAKLLDLFNQFLTPAELTMVLNTQNQLHAISNPFLPDGIKMVRKTTIGNLTSQAELVYDLPIQFRSKANEKIDLSRLVPTLAPTLHTLEMIQTLANLGNMEPDHIESALQDLMKKFEEIDAFQDKCRERYKRGLDIAGSLHCQTIEWLDCIQNNAHLLQRLFANVQRMRPADQTYHVNQSAINLAKQICKVSGIGLG